MRQRSSK